MTIIDLIRENKTPEIEEHAYWDPDNVRKMCIKYNLYNAGNNKDYSTMLEYVGLTDPSPYHLYWVGRDILEHTVDHHDLGIENLMWFIKMECCFYGYSISEEEEQC